MKRKAMAIPLVLIFATIMGFVSLFLFRSAKSYNQQNRVSFAQLQSYFIARAGVEHTMLKIKYLHRELYDAICLSQGRNPLYDYSLVKTDSTGKVTANGITSYNPGPIFLCKSGEYDYDSEKGLFLSNFNNNSVDLGKHNVWLKTFESDLNSLATDPVNIKEVVHIHEMPDNIKALMKEPFEAQYFVSDLGVSAAEVEENTANVVDNNVVVEFTVKSILKTAKDEDFDLEMKKTIRVSRD